MARTLDTGYPLQNKVVKGGFKVNEVGLIHKDRSVHLLCITENQYENVGFGIRSYDFKNPSGTPYIETTRSSGIVFTHFYESLKSEVRTKSTHLM